MRLIGSRNLILIRWAKLADWPILKSRMNSSTDVPVIRSCPAANELAYPLLINGSSERRILATCPVSVICTEYGVPTTKPNGMRWLGSIPGKKYRKFETIRVANACFRAVQRANCAFLRPTTSFCAPFRSNHKYASNAGCTRCWFGYHFVCSP